jgi:L-ascorbate metabolism protein UlaG (beta-lactamase superfamily)
LKLCNISITCLADKHQCHSISSDSIAKTCPPNNPIELDNAIQIIEAGGLRIVVWGDNRPTPDSSLDRYLENVDVLILPVETVLTRAEADAIIEKYNPRTVVPAHYFLNGLTADAVGLESADGWVNYEEKIRHAEVRRLNSADLTLNAAELKGAHHRVYYFGNHFEEK